MHVTYIIIVAHVNEVKCNLTELTTRSHCCQWFRYICTWVRFLLLLVVVLIHWCGRKKEHLALFSLPSPLYFPLLISVMSACPHGGVRAYGCVVRFCQPSVQSPSWSWLPIVEAPGCLRHQTST